MEVLNAKDILKYQDYFTERQGTSVFMQCYPLYKIEFND